MNNFMKKCHISWNFMKYFMKFHEIFSVSKKFNEIFHETFFSWKNIPSNFHETRNFMKLFSRKKFGLGKWKFSWTFFMKSFMKFHKIFHKTLFHEKKAFRQSVMKFHEISSTRVSWNWHFMKYFMKFHEISWNSVSPGTSFVLLRFLLRLLHHSPLDWRRLSDVFDSWGPLLIYKGFGLLHNVR
jgi:hypothetical protein